MAGWLKRDLRIGERVLLVALAVVIVARVVAPYVLKHMINRRLQEVPGYTGHVESVGMHVLHGGYSMHGFVLEKVGSQGRNEPFVAAKDVTFIVDYGQLVHGKFVGDIDITQGSMTIKESPAPQLTQTAELHVPQPAHAPKPAKSFRDLISSLFPINITHLKIVDSRLHYVNTKDQPPIDVEVNHLALEGTGLQNRPSEEHTRYPAAISAVGTTIGGGELRLDIQMDPLADKPEFRIFALLQNAALPAMNTLLASKANVAVSKGYLQLYMEVAAHNGSYTGYFKPIFTDLHFETPRTRKNRPLAVLWKDIVNAATKLVRNGRSKQVATVVPFSGTFGETSRTSIGALVSNLFRNGFVVALRRGLEANETGGKPPT